MEDLSGVLSAEISDEGGSPKGGDGCKMGIFQSFNFVIARITID